MPLSRSHFRSKSRSPAPNASQFTSASRTPIFLPPSHYAAAAGIDYGAIARSRAEGSSPRPPGDIAGFSPASPLLYPTQTASAELPHPTASQTTSHSGLNRMSRFIARSPSLSKSAALRRSGKEDGKDKAEAAQRESCMVDLPLVELQLIPTLRDTVDKMTHPPTPIVPHQEDEGLHDTHFRPYPGVHEYPEGGDTSSVSSHGSSRSSTYSVHGSSNSIGDHVLLQRSTAESALHCLNLRPNSGLRPPRAIKSALRSPSPSVERSTDAPLPSVTESLRKSRFLAPRGTLPVDPQFTEPRASSVIARPSRIPGIRTRPADALPPADSHGNSLLPLPKRRNQSTPSTGALTPQPPPCMRPGFPAFKTPQPAQSAFSPRPNYPQPTEPRKSGSGSDVERNGAVRGRSNLPRFNRKCGRDRGSDTGSDVDIERRANPGLGKLIIANAHIVPSSSEESTGRVGGGERKIAAQRSHEATLRSTATMGSRSDPQRKPNTPVRDVRGEQQSHARALLTISRERGQTVGLGFRMSPSPEGTRGRSPERGKDDEESVYDEEDCYSLDESDAERGNEETSSDEDGSRKVSVDSSHERRRHAALLGIVDNMQASYDVQRSSGKSVLSQSESDVYYEQGVAIGTSSDFQSGSFADVSLPASVNGNVGQRADINGLRKGDENSEDEEEQSNYSEEESSSLVEGEDELDEAGATGQWWIRGRRSSRALATQDSQITIKRNRRPSPYSGDSDRRKSLLLADVQESLGSPSTMPPIGTSRYENRSKHRLSVHQNSSAQPAVASLMDVRARRRMTISERTPNHSQTMPEEIAPGSMSPKDIRARQRMTIAFVRQPATTSRRSSVVSVDTDRTPRASEPTFFANAPQVFDQAVDDEDSAERERQAFGIPRSLSFGAGNSELSVSEVKGAQGSLLRSESDDSLLSGPSSMTRDSSYMADVWRNSAGKEVLSKGAYALFEGLAGEPPVAGTDDDGIPRCASKEEQFVSSSMKTRPRSPYQGKRPRSRQGALTQRRLKDEPPTPLDLEDHPDFPSENTDSQESYAVSSVAPIFMTSQGADCPRNALSPGEHLAAAVPTEVPSPAGGSYDRAPDPSSSSQPAHPWRSTLSLSLYNGLLSHYGPREMERQEVLFELLQSERAFVKRVRATISTFVIPLRANASRTWLPGVPAEVSRLFDWLDDILNLHTSILRVLKIACRAWETGEIVAEVANALLSLVPGFEVHQPYLVRVDEVRELLLVWAQDKHSQFGEYIRLREGEELCDGWSLERCLQDPVHRLSAYMDIFRRLLQFTDKRHPDFLATLSLLRSTCMTIRVMEEVRVREEEYEYVKDVALLLIGSDASAQLLTRERRLLNQGHLHWVSTPELASTPQMQTTPMLRINGKPLQRASLRAEPSDRDVPERAMRLASAIHDWHVRRARSGSLSSSASSSLSLWSNDSMSSATPTTPASDAQPSAERFFEAVNVQAFVFTDLVLLAAPSRMHDNTDATEGWRLLDDLGLTRVLEFRVEESTQVGRVVTLDLIPVDIQDLTSSIHGRTGSVSTISLRLLDTSDESERYWIAALEQSRVHTLHCLSFPPPTHEDLQGPVGDYEQDAYHCVKSILASGLPLPKSPSMQLEDGQGHEDRDITEQEREERGWWSLRFHQILREFQRRPSTAGFVTAM